jgi:hypothetical protein
MNNIQFVLRRWRHPLQYVQFLTLKSVRAASSASAAAPGAELPPDLTERPPEDNWHLNFLTFYFTEAPAMCFMCRSALFLLGLLFLATYVVLQRMWRRECRASPSTESEKSS